MLTDTNYFGPGAQWPPKTENERFQRYKETKTLFDGKHEVYLKDWIVKLFREEYQTSLLIVLNWYKRLSTLWPDLLLGETPRITAPEADDKVQAAIKKYIENGLINKAYMVVMDGSRYATGIFKVRLKNNKVKISIASPDCWIPVVEPDDQTEIKAHIIGYTFERSIRAFGGERIIKYLKLEIHTIGHVKNVLYQLDNNNKIQYEVDIKTIFPDLSQEEDTGVNDFLVFPFCSLITSDCITGLDDYKDIEGIVQELEIRISQMSRILDKHADPGMYGPASALTTDPQTGKTVADTAGKYIPVNPGDSVPGYLTWDGKFDAAFKEIDYLLNELFRVSETCKACFGDIDAGQIQSGAALKRLLMIPLKKVDRLKMNLDPIMKRVIKAALQLEPGLSVSNIDDLSINIDWQDGIPQDPLEQANIENIRTNGKATTTVKDSIMRQDGIDEKSAQEKADQILKEENDSQPNIFNSDYNKQPPDKTPGDGSAAAGSGDQE